MTVVEYAWVTPDPNAVPRSMPEPRLLLIVEEDVADSWTLREFAADGAHAGDTVHLSREDAHHQAQHELGDRVGDWTRVSWSHNVARTMARDLVRASARKPSRRITQEEAARLAEDEEMLLRFERTYGRGPHTSRELEDAYEAGKLTTLVIQGGRLKPSQEAHRRIREKFTVEGE